MNEYQKAYAVFRLEPGSSKETIQTRYKRLIMVWHPDRFKTDEEKSVAEEELKIINNAKDLLFTHFDSPEHKAVACECQQSSEKAQNESGEGAKAKSAAEEAAERRDAERQARETVAESPEASSDQESQAPSSVVEQADKPQKKTMDLEALRWKIAYAEGAVFIALVVFAFIGGGIHRGIDDIKSTINKQVVDEQKRQNPVLLEGQYSSAPARIEPNLTPGIKDKVQTWTVKADGSNNGAVIEGRDSANHLLVIQFYNGDWSIDHQDLMQSNGNDITVERYRTPAEYLGRCIYHYDNNGNFLEVSKFDQANNLLVTASVERTSTGALHGLIVKPSDGPPVTYFDADGTNAKAQFFSSSMLMQIASNVQPVPSSVPDSVANPFTPGLSPSAGNQLETFPGRKERSPFR